MNVNERDVMTRQAQYQDMARRAEKERLIASIRAERPRTRRFAPLIWLARLTTWLSNLLIEWRCRLEGLAMGAGDCGRLDEKVA